MRKIATVLLIASAAWAQPSPEPIPSPEPMASPQPMTQPPLMTRERPFGQKVLIGLSFGAGALGVGGFILGGVEAARDGRACTPKPPRTECPQYRNTASGQLLGFVSGSVLSLVAVAFGTLGWWKLPPRVLVAPELAPGGAGVRVRISY